MKSVTGRISEIKQPWGGYVKPSQFTEITINDNEVLTASENVHATIIGLVVDYLTRFMMGVELTEAFSISHQGAERATKLGHKDAIKIAEKLILGIKDIDENSIINACKLVTFDVWRRNLKAAHNAKGVDETNPDFDTIHNIQIMIKRSLAFWKEYGPIIMAGFTFEPMNDNKENYIKMLLQGEGSFGGYTSTVTSGGGDYLTKDTLWDFKVLKSKVKSKHTLQLLMYWIMGQHSGRDEFKNISKLGVFNPRLNAIYTLDIVDVPKEIIEIIEKEVICY